MIISELFIFSGFSICSFLSLLLAGKKGRDRTDMVLLLYLLSTVFILLLSYISFAYDRNEFLLVIMYSNQFQIPILFLYVFSLMNYKIIKRRIVIIFTPLILSVIYLLSAIVIFPEEYLNLLFSSNILTAPVLYKITLFFELLYPPLFIFFLLKKNRDYVKSIKNNYSFLKGLDLRWIRMFLMLELITWFFQFISDYILNVYNPDKEIFYLEISIALSSVAVIYLAYFALGYTGIFNRYKVAAPENPYKKSRLPENDAEIIQNLIEKLMKEDKVYRDPYLSLSVLSELIGEANHLLSQTFSQNFRQSFYDFVNSYRVLEVKQRIEEGEWESKTLLAIAMDSGFNSKATFNRYFKKTTGQTPSQYVKLVSSKRLSRQ